MRTLIFLKLFLFDEANLNIKIFVDKKQEKNLARALRLGQDYFYADVFDKQTDI